MLSLAECTPAPLIAPIDPAASEVADRIVAIQRDGYAVEAGLMGFDGIPQLHESVEDVERLGHMVWRGAFSGTTLVGLIAWEQLGEIIDIDGLVVGPAFARQGHGMRPVQSAPPSRVATVSTGTDNGPALALYWSLGFREAGQTEVAEDIFTTQLERRID